MKEIEHILVLLESDVRKLRALSLNMKTSPEFQAYFNDLMRRNNTTIEHIEMLQSSDSVFFSFDCLSPHASTGMTSKLSYLEFQGLTMTRDAFSSMLRIFPCLTKLDMENMTLKLE
ncbi:hypothetical protein BGZ65_001050, partial [Modicella reniformis]